MKIFRRSGNHLGDSLCVLLNGRSPLSESHINLRTLEYKQYLLLLESAGKTEKRDGMKKRSGGEICALIFEKKKQNKVNYAVFEREPWSVWMEVEM